MPSYEEGWLLDLDGNYLKVTFTLGPIGQVRSRIGRFVCVLRILQADLESSFVSVWGMWAALARGTGELFTQFLLAEEQRER